MMLVYLDPKDNSRIVTQVPGSIWLRTRIDPFSCSRPLREEDLKAYCLVGRKRRITKVTDIFDLISNYNLGDDEEFSLALIELFEKGLLIQEDE